MDCCFQFRSITGFDGLESFYQDFERQLGNDAVSQAVFNLCGLSFVTPELLIPLVCATRIWAESKGQRVRWDLKDDDVLKYIERAGALTMCLPYLEKVI